MFFVFTVVRSSLRHSNSTHLIAYNSAFLEDLETRLGRQLKAQKRGRRRKAENNKLTVTDVPTDVPGDLAVHAGTAADVQEHLAHKSKFVLALGVSLLVIALGLAIWSLV